MNGDYHVVRSGELALGIDWRLCKEQGGDEVTRQHTTWAIVFAIVILLVLAALPAQAQDIGGATSSALYLPSIERNFVLWFTDAELDAAMERDGYDPVVASMHTNCYLDASATPPHDVRYSS